MIDENNSDINEELTIAVCGPVDAGKSTIIGVLTSGELDNGKGLARNKVLIHPHEIESGRTSNITFNPLIYNISNNRLLLIDPHTTKDDNTNKIKDISYLQNSFWMIYLPIIK